MSAFPTPPNSVADLLVNVKPTINEPSWKTAELVLSEQERVAQLLENSDEKVVTENGLICWSKDEFESEVLNRSVAKIGAVLGSGFENDFLKKLAKEYQQASVRINAASYDEISVLHRAGFVTVDHLVTFGGSLGEHTVSDEVRLSKPEDTNQVASIAATAFKDGRYFNDPWVSQEEGSLLYKTWASNAIKRNFGDATFVAGFAPSAFLVAQIREDLPEKCGVIVLVAAAEESRGQGLGAKLVKAAQSWFVDQNCTYMLVGTQSTNETAQKFYKSLGLKEVSRSVTLSWGQP